MGISLDHGKEVDLCTWQASKGWARVPEAALERTIDGYDLRADLGPTPKDVAHTDHLALHLSRKFLKDLTYDDCQMLMALRAEEEEDPQALEFAEEALDTDVFLDIATRDDQQEAKKQNEKIKVATQSLSKRLAISKRLVDDSFKHYPKTKPLAVAKVVSAAKLHTVTGSRKWWNSMRGDPTFLDLWKPPGSSVYTDQQKGLWKVTLGPMSRSFSWTVRGQEAAVGLCLRSLWDEHVMRHPGEPMPPTLAALLAAS